MTEKFSTLTDAHIEFIQKQHLYFVATAGADGYVNLSPKGLDSFRVLNSTKISWQNLTGSGNETAAHMLENNRMTIMFCSFDKQPLILRLYGRAGVMHPRDKEWQESVALFPEHVSTRQIFTLDLDLVQTSCGYGVPYYQLEGERPTLTKLSNSHSKAGIEKYWKENNTTSLNGKETGI